MTLEEVLKVKELLDENDFIEVTGDNLELLDGYIPAGEIARKLMVRFDAKEMSTVLMELGYKNYVDKCPVPTNAENSAYMLKSFTDEDTQVEDFYIQCLWKRSVIDEINDVLQKDENFKTNRLPELQKENQKEKEFKIQNFKEITDYVAVVVKKTGFNINKDFAIYISYAEIKDKEMVNNVFLPVNDGIDEERSEHYYAKNELTDMSPFDYIKINLPHVDPQQEFMDRKDVLRKIYNDFKGKKIVFFNKEESRFIKKMFEEEGIPEAHAYESIIDSDYGIKELIDWMNPNTDLKLKKVYEFYKIPFNKSENKYLQESKRLAQLTFRALSMINK